MSETVKFRYNYTIHGLVLLLNPVLFNKVSNIKSVQATLY